MNSYEKYFFKRYLPEGSEIHHVIHRHIILILDRFFIFIFWLVLLPSFIYTQSYRVQELVPFFYFEMYLFMMFLKIIYDIFNWYNDVWIITQDNLYDVKWSLFKSNIESVHYDNIEWVETEQNGFIDMVLGKWNLVIHKHGDDTLRIMDVSRPFESSNILSEFTHKEEAEPEKDRFELILHTLWGIVNEYLNRQGIRETPGGLQNKQEEYIEEIATDDGTIDLRGK